MPAPRPKATCWASLASPPSWRAKRTSELIPLCHPLPLSRVDVAFAFDADATAVSIEVRCETVGPTGVEMEALGAVAIGLLTIYDMCKAVDRGMRIEDVGLLEKSGGRSGHFLAPGVSSGRWSNHLTTGPRL